jgi:hypothetical protein
MEEAMWMIRALAGICCSMLVFPQVAFCQERAPNGQVYGELRPFVGLEGVTVELFGLRGIIYNIPGASTDPAKDATGLSSSELEQLDRSIREDIGIAFKDRGVPLLERAGQSPDTTPRLEIRVSWMRINQEITVIDVTTRLREAARLIKEPSKIVWAETWGTGLAGYPTSPESLVKDVRRVALGGVRDFLQLYVRAHAQ